jgi:hypothetical protein
MTSIIAKATPAVNTHLAPFRIRIILSRSPARDLVNITRSSWSAFDADYSCKKKKSNVKTAFKRNILLRDGGEKR